jgi:hypothetical protein
MKEQNLLSGQKQPNKYWQRLPDNEIYLRDWTLALCIKYALAGFTNSISGLWTFCEIEKEDFISFLYGAKVFNLYKVKEKQAVKNAERLPPWPFVTFKMSGRTYFFPFRLILDPIRRFEEPMVRPEFAYVAENLLLRGGYRKTHFQADQTTLQSVSEMGCLYDRRIERLDLNDVDTFVPRLTWDKTKVASPEIFKFQEFILQTLSRRFLSNRRNLQSIFASIGMNDFATVAFEALGEKALPEGHIDVLVKESTPKGLSRKIVVEVKSGPAKPRDIDQSQGYMDEIGEECLGGLLVAGKFSKKTLFSARSKRIKPFVYSFKNIDRTAVYSFAELVDKFCLNEV